ncbi:MAG TPA: hypothetical protein VGS18_01585, partial [Thermoplasmata archaeon]|nr:hypothetical protein [Thermoplasmata archaeon]
MVRSSGGGVPGSADVTGGALRLRLGRRFAFGEAASPPGAGVVRRLALRVVRRRTFVSGGWRTSRTPSVPGDEGAASAGIEGADGAIPSAGRAGLSGARGAWASTG